MSDMFRGFPTMYVVMSMIGQYGATYGAIGIVMDRSRSSIGGLAHRAKASKKTSSDCNLDSILDPREIKALKASAAAPEVLKARLHHANSASTISRYKGGTVEQALSGSTGPSKPNVSRFFSDEDEVEEKPKAATKFNVSSLFEDDDTAPVQPAIKKPEAVKAPAKLPIARSLPVVREPIQRRSRKERATNAPMSAVLVLREIFPYPPEPLKLGREQIRAARAEGLPISNENTFDYQRAIRPKIHVPYAEPKYAGKYLSELNLETECGVIVGHDGKEKENKRFTPLYCGHTRNRNSSFHMCPYHLSYMVVASRVRSDVPVQPQPKEKMSKFLMKR